MKQVPGILIFDVGKTNKKILVFDELYRVIHEESTRLEETIDEDGFPCENINTLTEWIITSFNRVIKDVRFEIRAVNFSAYGASFVYLDENQKVFLPLYNYLKPFPDTVKKKFYQAYGGELNFSKVTASPVLGSLNSGMQLYRIRQERPETFNKIKYALHLPQYLSYAITGQLHSELTSVGCHTNLWDFTRNTYHEWITTEGINTKLPPMIPGDSSIVVKVHGKNIAVGVGLHDSSSALIPYLSCFSNPFILLSTGTWSISLNPFNTTPLTQQELEKDCLCYLSCQGKPVKASRLFAGHEHAQQVKEITESYHVTAESLTCLNYDQIESISALSAGKAMNENHQKAAKAYAELVNEIVTRQVESTRLVIDSHNVRQIFVDGGFSNNQLYLHQLAASFPNVRVYSASVPQASALGAALILHTHWNPRPIPGELIQIEWYQTGEAKTTSC